LTINTKNITSIIEDLKNLPTRLMIVTKNQSNEDISELIDQGFKLFGENRVQEAKLKYLKSNLYEKNIELHLIGPLQTNKVKDALKIFDVIQTVDRASLVDEISKQLIKLTVIKTKKFFIQVNIGDESQKSGVSVKDLRDLYDYSIDRKLNIHGLMCIPPNILDPKDHFKEMINLRDKINSQLKLSMGMSNDYKIALQYKSDIIRVGSLIFS
jgi:pyridoxal phosphate enzyme (YggS family)